MTVDHLSSHDSPGYVLGIYAGSRDLGFDSRPTLSKGVLGCPDSRPTLSKGHPRIVLGCPGYAWVIWDLGHDSRSLVIP